ncbi:MAG: tetratricopeptide repeat protein [Planctomycetes bacterium]|nr:tetratricopeptide repeat protein [Planctomycetota bacterium]
MIAEARDHVRGGRYDEARRLLAQRVVQVPDDADAWQLLALSHLHLGQPAEARAAAQKATTMAPERASSQLTLGQVMQQQNELLAAETAYRKAIELNPNFHQAYQKLGIVLEKRWQTRQPTSDVQAGSDSARDVRSWQSRFNESTRACWELFTPHRQRVTSLLLDEPADRRGSLSVLGAGNCNDLDLKELCRVYSTIHLVDIDEQSIVEGTRAQQIEAPSEQLQLHGGVDVTGVARWFDGRSAEQPPETSELLDCIQQARTARVDLPGNVDVAISTCLLSQLMTALDTFIGAAHAEFTRLAAAIRTRHLELLIGSVRPGGRALIVTDVASSEMVPELRSCGQKQLPKLLERIMTEERFLTGVNPFHLQRLCHDVPSISAQVQQVRVSHPWLWYLPGKTHVVCAISFTRGSPVP